MLPPTPRFLLAANAFALPIALLADGHLPLAAGLATAGLLFAVAARHPTRLAGLAGLPALLAALPPHGPSPRLPPSGPVLVRGPVVERVHDPSSGSLWLLVGRPPDGIGVRCHPPLDVLPGDRIEALALLTPPSVPGTRPCLATVAGAIRVRPARPSVPRFLERAREACERRILGLVPGERGSVLATLVLGRATRAPREVAAAHRATGLSHLLAVSGAHAAMLGWLLGLGGSIRGRRLGRSRRHLSIALLLLFAYAGITGAEPPVVRAVSMYALAVLASRTGRPLGLLAGLSVPALVTAATAPGALRGPSFLLSYAAVFGLSLTRPRGRGPLDRWIRTPLQASFWATCTTAPLTLCWFGQFAPWTVLLTPVLAPLVATLLLLALGACCVGALAPGAADLLAPPLRLLTDLYVDGVELACRLPATPLPAAWIPPTWLLASCALVGAAGILLRPRRSTLLAAVGLFLAPWWLPWQGPTTPRFVLFAVGHGQAALLETEAGRRVAIDCGSLRGAHRAAERLTAALRVRRLDWLVITHADHDHRGGVPALLSRVAIEHALLPSDLASAPLAATLRKHGVGLRLLHPGERFSPCAGLLVAAPILAGGGSRNDASLWARVSCEGTSVLLTGDAEEAGVSAALEQGLAPPSDVLVLPHHGRPNENGPALLRAVAPSACLASAGGGDSDTALGGLAERSGIPLWVTGRSGDLEVLFGPPPALRCGGRRTPIGVR